MSGDPGKPSRGLACDGELTAEGSNAPAHTRAADLRGASVSVVVCAYTLERWEALQEAIASLAHQTRPPEQTIVVVDHNPALFDRARESFTNATVVANAAAAPGLSGARNTGVRVAQGEIIAFLDDDARAHPAWLAELARAYGDPNVVGAGGLVEPRWSSGRAIRWLPSEFYWTIGCSYRGLPSSVAAIRNPIGANMSFRREAILAAGGFREGVGRVGTIPLGCEETEMAVRVANAVPGGAIMHIPTARVDHLVGDDRACWRYFLARCWAEGKSKAIVTHHVGQGAGLASERTYVLRTLPQGVFRHLYGGIRGDVGALARAATILAGLSATVIAYLSATALGMRASSLERHQ